MHDLLQLIQPNKTEHGEGSIGTENSPMRNIAVKEIMTDSVVTAKPDSTIREAVELMIKRDIQGLIVYDEKKVRGILTATDVLLALAALKRNEIKQHSFTLQMSHGNLVDYDRDYVYASLTGFIKKFEKFLVGGYVNVYFKQHKETFRGTPLILCRVRLKIGPPLLQREGRRLGRRRRVPHRHEHAGAAGAERQGDLQDNRYTNGKHPGKA